MLEVDQTQVAVPQQERAVLQQERMATPRSYLMCPPTYFAVETTTNPWMDPDRPVDVARAVRQWQDLVDTYRGLGHAVALVEPDPALPDMVFAADGGLVIDGVALGARFRHPHRQGESAHFLAWFTAAGLARVTMPLHVNEGEGDLLVVGDRVLAGTGFRTDPAAHREVAEHLGREVVSLQLVDPRYYHLNTALGVVDRSTVAYLPSAFSDDSRRTLERLYPDALLAEPEDAACLGLNLVGDGRHVVLPAQATRLARALADRGYVPVPVDVSELTKSGGAVKCCTLELHGAAR